MPIPIQAAPPGITSRPKHRPQCTHITMVRLYGEYPCKYCYRRGEFGWVYRCTQDREDIIEFDAATSHQVADDDLGRFLASQISVRKRSAAARRDRLSFLEELDSKQLSQYRPDQIASILRQREEVHHAIARDQFQDQIDILSQILYKESRVPSLHEQERSKHPWVPNLETECQYTVCPACRPRCMERANLSLVGVSKGETLPTAAVGFGFHGMGGRPIVDAAMLKTLGCRPVPLSRSGGSYDSSSSFSFSKSMLELLDQQLSHGRLLAPPVKTVASNNPDDTCTEARTTCPRESVGQLRHSPRCENLVALTNATERNQASSQVSCVRSPWTPPASPSLHVKQSVSELHMLGWARKESISNGGRHVEAPRWEHLTC